MIYVKKIRRFFLLPLPLLFPLSTFVERGIGGEVFKMLNYLTQKESFIY
jgi:hypothetical protein